ncbi:IQ motif, EF-hand binding site [Phytophthora cactorum]|nr:IQ motif, EF-hand binding site [Phytophthora cactorum]
MTLTDSRESQAATELARPTPPPAKSSPGRGPGYHHHAAGKHFTVRDGFHLKIRNAEAQAAIDAQLVARGESPDPLALPERDDNFYNISPRPTKQEIIPALPSPKRMLATGRKINNNNNLEDQYRNGASTNADELIDGANYSTSTAVAILDQLLQPEYSSQDSGRTTSRAGASGMVRVPLRAPAEWLIYRHRPSETKQRRQQKVDKLLNEVLQEPEESQKVRHMKQEEVLRAPMRPRYQSTVGSTYTQRVAAARPQKHQSCEHKQNYHGELLQPLTETERGLLRSREDNNKAVDKLLVSLFHPPSTSATPPTAGTSFVKPTTPTNRFSTRRSMIRHETAVALRSRNLVSRMNELRSLPQLLEQMEALQLWKKQQRIAEHGVNIVARNRVNSTWQVLQKPSQTPLLPSATDHKVRQANKRKQELDAAKEENVHRIMGRWRFATSSGPKELVVFISKKWLSRFHEFRKKRTELVRIIMVKRLQRYWRQQTLVQHNSLQLLRFEASIPLSSAFFRMPVVIRAVNKLQQSIRDWLERKHHRERKDDVALIVTAWFEFQDVKFRRIILRFRKRVRDFQVMWRAWRAITAARIKLLLLVWAKLERKIKRRHGVVTFSLPNDPRQLKSGSNSDEANSGLRTGKGLTILDMLQRSTAESPLNQQHKQLEGMHRHFRNGGAVHMPIGAVSPGSLGPQGSTDNSYVRQDLQLRNNMEEEFQLVMYDVYTARQNLSPKWSKSTIGAKLSPTKTRKSSPHVQSSPLQVTSTGSNNLPVPPSVSRKVPHQLKVAVLRKLLSEKRKMYSDARDREREAWAAARKQMRSEAFRYDVLDELAAFQQLQAKYTTFLVLHSITETEMVRLIHQAQIEVNAAESAATSQLSQTHRNSIQGVGGGPRKSLLHVVVNNA